ncbi:MAG: hypothetical protein ACI4QL_03355, partial [Candidatus Fimimonas sp.]
MTKALKPFAEIQQKYRQHAEFICKTSIKTFAKLQWKCCRHVKKAFAKFNKNVVDIIIVSTSNYFAMHQKKLLNSFEKQ